MAGLLLTRRFYLIAFTGLLLIILGGIANGFPEVVDLADNRDFVNEGYGVLHLDYLAIWDNMVLEDGADYPLGTIWLILYDPDPYADMDEMDEEDWDPSDELGRFQVPGLGSRDRWSNSDEIIYRNAGLYEWESDKFDRIVFRVLIENSSADYDTSTIIWGVINKDEAYTASEYDNEYASIKFRTTDLPEYDMPPYVTFNELWFEHEVNVDGQDGVMLHADFQVDNMRGEVARLAAFVHYDENDESVECQIDNPDYMTSDGYLTYQTDMMPLYPYTVYSDTTLFFPYDAFPESDDYIQLYMHVELLDADWNYIGAEDSPVFEVNITK
ncbi:MAG: hypothetical protein NTY09_03060 [bacterium]|nr:hypothetical protein [bacterium]